MSRKTSLIWDKDRICQEKKNAVQLCKSEKLVIYQSICNNAFCHSYYCDVILMTSNTTWAFLIPKIGLYDVFKICKTTFSTFVFYGRKKERLLFAEKTFWKCYYEPIPKAHIWVYSYDWEYTFLSCEVVWVNI